MKKQRKPIVNYVISNVMLYVYLFVFSLIAIVFMADSIWKWVQILMGIIFIAPVALMFFVSGKREGENVYKEAAKGTLTQIHDKKPVVVPVYKVIYYIIGFAVPLILLCLIGGLANVVGIRGLIIFAFMPVTLFFIGCNVIILDAASAVYAQLLYIYIPVIILLCLMFVAGFILSVIKLKRQQAEIESELRSFDN